MNPHIEQVHKLIDKMWRVLEGRKITTKERDDLIFELNLFRNNLIGAAITDSQEKAKFAQEVIKSKLEFAKKLDKAGLLSKKEEE